MNTEKAFVPVLDDSFIPYPENAVAIIGMAGHYPDTNGVDDFWRALKDGYCPLSTFSDDELEVTPDVDIHDKRLVKKGYVIDDIADFDADFFGFSDTEALLTDPQQRLFLQVAWQALERAGYATGKVDVPVSVFASANFNTYGMRFGNAMNNVDLHKFLQVVVGNDKEYMASRLSYLLNLNGPALNIQTACSSSLVAISLACQSLQCYQSDIAVVGAAALKARQRSPYVAQEGGASSRDARCRAFDGGATGIIEGFGAGAVVLKRYEDAVKDRDHMHALIAGHAINNDGSRKVGYSAPSADAQTQVLREALDMSGLAAEDLRFIEAHGTGTPLGDPIEVTALNEVYGHSEKKIFLGSVKTNIGHLDAAAGVSGLIKAAKVMETGTVPPTLHFEQANPNIPFAQLPFEVNTQLQQLSSESPSIGAISSFGLGGNNSHLLLTQAPAYKTKAKNGRAQLLPLSARTEEALHAAVTQLDMYFNDAAAGSFNDTAVGTSLADVAYTLQRGRKTFIKRSFIIATDADEAQRQLRESLPVYTEFERQQVVFLCPGVGTQQVNMGLAVYQQEAVFADVLRECEQKLRVFAPDELPLLDILYPQTVDDAAEARLSQPLPAMAATFAVTIATARLLQSWGLAPDALAGHSVGQYAAAYLAGVITLDDALFLLVERAKCMDDTPEGAMLAVRTSEEKLAPLLTSGAPQPSLELSLGAVNTSKLCLVSGTRSAIEAFESTLKSKRIPSAKLPVTKAGHSHLLDPVLPRFAQSLGKIQFNAPQIPMLCNLTGRWLSESELSADYWLRHLRSTVRFADMIDTLAESPGSLFYELGQGTSLLNMVQQHCRAIDKNRCIATLGTLTQSGCAELLAALGQGWAQGADIDWQRCCSDANAGFVPLPTYPFEKQRYWVDEVVAPAPALSSSPASSASPEASSDDSPLSWAPLSWAYVPSWRAQPGTLASTELLQDKQVWLIGHSSFNDALLHALSDTGASVLRLAPSHNFGWAQQVPSLFAEHGAPDILVHATNLAPREEIWPADLELGLEQSCFDVVALMQALESQAGLKALPVLMLSSQSISVSGESDISPLKSVAQALPLVVNRECRQLGCRYVDIDPSISLPRQAQLALTEMLQVLQLDDPMASLKATEAFYAWRGRCRWQRAVQLQPLDNVTHNIEQHNSEQHAQAMPLRHGGNYVILGGFGGIGFTLAQALVEHFNANIILAGRNVPPPQAQWGAAIAREGVDSQLAKRIKLWRSLQSNGNRVLALPLDLADKHSVDSFWQNAETEFGTLHGVIHAAGETGGGLFTLQGKQGCKANLDAKLRGLANLHDHLAGSELDFLLLSSSLSTYLGASGQLDNLVGNFALDAMAYTSTFNFPVMTVNWDYWLDVGMIQELDAQHYALTGEHLDEGIPPPAGRDLLAPILASGRPQVLISTQDLLARCHAALHDNLSGLADFENLSTAASQKARPEIKTTYAAPETPLHNLLVVLWQTHLGIDNIGIDDGFIALGGNSLLALPLMAELRELLAEELPLKLLFETESIRGLAEHLERNPTWAEALRKILDAEAEIAELSEAEIAELLESNMDERNVKESAL